MPSSGYFTFSATSNYDAAFGQSGVTVNIGSGTNFNDADGVGSASGENNYGYGSLSGIDTTYRRIHRRRISRTWRPPGHCSRNPELRRHRRHQLLQPTRR